MFNHIINQAHTAFAYSDNVYYFNGKDYFSLDVSSMECSHTQHTIRMNMRVLLEKFFGTKLDMIQTY